MQIESNYEFLVKIIIIGDSGVGKTNFMFRFADNTFNSLHVSTVGLDYKSKIIILPSSKKKSKNSNMGHSRSRTLYGFK